QRKVEARNFDIRKQLLQYDDVANDQRKVIYAQRNEVLESGDITETISSLREAAVSRLFREYVPQDTMEEQWDIPGLTTALQSTFQIDLPLAEMLEKESNLTDDDLHDRVIEESQRLLQAKIDQVGQPNWGNFERAVLLQSIDTQWRGHLQALDHLRQGIHLRGYAQKDPKQEYKREAFELFSDMLDRVRDEVVKVLMTVRIQTPEQVEEAAAEVPANSNVRFHHSDYDAALSGEDPGLDEVAKGEVPRVGRNDPCPCGSGKKYKQCHGRLN
ncbi:MAG TPA: SEC-C metal-binding domain-containing protein, partial [Alcaligenes faecalis]|nr:SEC-C metal-binding domain-containing protein [Alcaligenes faecalis]